MTRRFGSFALAGLLVVGFGLTSVVTAQTATADTQVCDQYGSTTIQGGRYVVQNDRWNTSQAQCVTATTNGFVLSTADGGVSTYGAPKSYPSIFFGCHYGNCSTSGDILTPSGLQASSAAFSGISTSLSMSYITTGIWNANYDIWFNKSQPTATTGQNDGAELMVWLNYNGPIQPYGNKIGTATILGTTWDVWFGVNSWNVISYVRQTPATSISFPLTAFWNDVVSRGYGSNSWYLTSIQSGFEPWDGGAGLSVDSFSVTTNGSTPTPTPTPSPTPTPTGSAGCKATLASANSWSGGFQGAVTVSNAGSSSISGWTVKWTFPNGQSIGNLWNGTLAQSGSSETVKNAPYNGSIAGNGSTSFGFVSTGSFPSSLALTCTTP